jgi:spore coat protein U-like protein
VTRRPAAIATATAFALASLLVSTAADAATSCSVTATGPVFGVYTAGTAAPLDANGSLAVTCTLLSGGTTTVTPEVQLSAGSSGTFQPRTMLSGTQKLNYNIYWSTAYAQIWGDGTGGSFYGTATLTLSPQAPTQQATGVLYGQIAAAQDPAPGSYSDTIVVTVTY